MSEPWNPRRHDHLVEPMFAGLDVKHGHPPARAGRGRWIVVVVLVALAIVAWRVVAS